MPNHQQFFFRIEGMDCAEEVKILKSELGRLVDADSQLKFDILNQRLEVDLREAGDSHSALSEETLLQAIHRTGMKATPWLSDALNNKTSDQVWFRNPRVLVILLSGVCLGGGVLSQLVWGASSDGLPWLSPSRIFYSFAILTGLFLFLPKAFLAARHLRPDMHLLMTIAMAGAIFIDEWFEAATISFLFAFSILMESWSVERARKAVSSLLELSPTHARKKLKDGSLVNVAASELEQGEVFVVHPGEKIPLDGTVLEGQSEVDQSPITGESQPVEKSAGAEVFGGTINASGVLTVQAIRRFDDSTLAHIIRMVSEAQSRRAASEKWVEKFAHVYTPVVIGLALLVAIIPPLLFGAWQVWFYRSLVLLVIACPCALVISTPVCIVAALTAAARNGILIKGGIFVELPARIRAIAFDKTGTLTEGKPQVLRVSSLTELSSDQVVQLIASLEAASDHPLARAMIKAARKRNLSLNEVSDLTVLPGKGLWGVVQGTKYWVGSPRLLREQGHEIQGLLDAIENETLSGSSVVVLGKEDQICGYVVLADRLRSQAATAIKLLREQEVEYVVMLTGDNQATADQMGRQAGVDEIVSELLPNEKVEQVERLVDTYEQVAMVGDGVNDAPALGRSSLGIAMARTGSDATIETSDITLMTDDLSKLPWLFNHSSRTVTTIRQNVWLAVGIKSLLVALTMVGYSSLWVAIAGDMGTSLLVIFNALRLLKPNP